MNLLLLLNFLLELFDILSIENFDFFDFFLEHFKEVFFNAEVPRDAVLEEMFPKEFKGGDARDTEVEFDIINFHFKGS